MTRNVKPFATRIRELIATSQGGPKSVVLDIGPEAAAHLLTLSRGNRAESADIVDKYARDMLACNWRLTHQGLGVDVTGRLFDGHHRLRAVVSAGVHIQTLVTFGLPATAVENSDMGRPRSIAAQIRLRDGCAVSSRLIATVRTTMHLEAGGQRRRVYSLAEVEAAIGRHEAALAHLSIETRNKYPASMWGALLYAYPIDPDAVARFGDDVVRGTDLPAGSPAFVLREHLRTFDAAGTIAKQGITARTLYALRAALEGRPLTRFSPRDDGAIYEWARKRRPS